VVREKFGRSAICVHEVRHWTDLSNRDFVKPWKCFKDDASACAAVFLGADRHEDVYCVCKVWADQWSLLGVSKFQKDYCEMWAF
jgi:hypothetical protein